MGPWQFLGINDTVCMLNILTLENVFLFVTCSTPGISTLNVLLYILLYADIGYFSKK